MSIEERWVEEHPLRAYRRREGQSQLALAKLLGVDRVTVARWEAGVRLIDYKRLAAIATATGIPARELRPDIAALMRGCE